MASCPRSKEKTADAGSGAAEQESKKRCCVYMLRCADGSLYTGWTNDLKKRVASHQAGTGGKYTRSHRPVELVYAEAFGSRSEAMKREAAVKRLTKEEKEVLAASGRMETGDTD